MQPAEKINTFVQDSDISWQVVGDKMQRKIMSYDERLMVVKVQFETGGIGALHQHHHTQITHVESGVFEVEIGSERKILKAGDVFYVPPNVIHGALCIESGILLDIFSPMREDFI